jgi:hypothetical protein
MVIIKEHQEDIKNRAARCIGQYIGLYLLFIYVFPLAIHVSVLLGFLFLAWLTVAVLFVSGKLFLTMFPTLPSITMRKLQFD